MAFDPVKASAKEKRRARVRPVDHDDRGELPAAPVKVPAVIGKAVAYYRTSSGNDSSVADTDTRDRQEAACREYARKAGLEIVGEWHDIGVSGTVPIDERPQFMEMMTYIAGNGARTVLVESPDRFARDLMVQLAGHDTLKKHSIALVPTTAPDFFTEETPTAVLMRQVLGAVAQFEKTALVLKLAGARKRKRTASPDGKCEGKKSLGELYPEAAALAKRLNKKRKGRKPSLRGIAVKLAAKGKGWHRENGEPWFPTSIKRLIEYRPVKTEAASTTSPMAK